MPDTTGTDVVEHTVRIAARRETVFPYFTDPERMCRWMGVEATLDPRPGGVCRVNPSGRLAMLGEYVEVDAPRRVVFTWGWEGSAFSTPPQSTRVEVSLEPDGDETVVRLVHSRMHPDSVVVHRTGWGHYLERLAVIAGGGDPGPDAFRDPRAFLRAVGQATSA